VDLAKLGVDVVAMGAVGDDLLADFLQIEFRRHGVNGSLLARKAGVQTAASILPVRPNGERPSLHCPGAISSLEIGDINWDELASADLLHVGGPDALGRFGGEPLQSVLKFARDHGAITTMDVQSPCDADAWERIWPALKLVNYFMPNDEQLLNLTGRADIVDAVSDVLSAGVKAVLVGRGSQGALLVTDHERYDLPALNVPVVDSTGCGDACSAGFIAGILQGWDLESSGWLAMTTGGLVVQGLGSDAGIVDLAGTIALLLEQCPSSVARRVRALVKEMSEK
jgi:sugar/nucleoside kinase (ribokinase family)